MSRRSKSQGAERGERQRGGGDADEGERVDAVFDRLAVVAEDGAVADPVEAGVEAADQVDTYIATSTPATEPVTTLVRSDQPVASTPKPAKSSASGQTLA